MILETGNLDHAIAVAKAAGCIFNPAVDIIISTSTDGVLRAGVIYQGYTGASIEMHVTGWGAGWLTKDFLWIVFDYPFNQLGCKSTFVQIPTRNSKSLAFAKKLGFKEVARIPEVFPDCDLSVMRMWRDDCRFLNISCAARRIMAEGSGSGQEK